MRRFSTTGSFDYRTRDGIVSFANVGAPRPPAKRLSSSWQDLYNGNLSDTRTELAIFFAVLGLTMVLAEPLAMTLIELLVPRWHAQLAEIPGNVRRWLFGGPAALLILAIGILLSWKRAAD